jgi:hypothetical protein
MSSEIDPM